MQSAQNQAPVVNTGDDQTVNSRQQVSARDPEDGELSYLWQQQLSQQVALVTAIVQLRDLPHPVMPVRWYLN